MDFDKKLFGMQLGDAMQLSGILRMGTGIHRLRLSECLINDETLHVLISGLQQNETITHLDLSHNKINDSGAQRFCRLLHEESVLREVDLVITTLTTREIHMLFVVDVCLVSSNLF